MSTTTRSRAAGAGGQQEVGRLAPLGGHVERGAGVGDAVGARAPGRAVEPDQRVGRVGAHHRDHAAPQAGDRLLRGAAVGRVGARHAGRQPVGVGAGGAGGVLRVGPEVRLEVDDGGGGADLAQEEAEVVEVGGHEGEIAGGDGRLGDSSAMPSDPGRREDQVVGERGPQAGGRAGGDEVAHELAGRLLVPLPGAPPGRSRKPIALGRPGARQAGSGASTPARYW